MNKKLLNFLKRCKAKYKLVKHKTVYTAYDAAQTQKLKLSEVAKTLLVRANGQFVFVVLPASKKIDFNKLKKEINKQNKKLGKKAVKKIALCSERQIVQNFTKGKSALPPFGSLYRCQTYLEKSLLRNKKINLNAGSFEESLEMTPATYRKIEKPIVGNFGK